MVVVRSTATYVLNSSLWKFLVWYYKELFEGELKFCDLKKENQRCSYLYLVTQTPMKGKILREACINGI